MNVTKAVAAGAALLDRHDPGWWRDDGEQPIDLTLLDLEDTGRCILGQRCPAEVLAGHLAEVGAEDDGMPFERYWAYVHELKQRTGSRSYLVFDWARRYGFAALPADYFPLTAEWKRLITERRAAA